MSSVSRSSSSNSLLNESVLKALHYEEDDAEHGSSIESDDDHNVIFAPTPPQVVLETPLPKKITPQDYVLYGIFTPDEIDSPRFPPTPVEYGESTPVYRQPQANELSLRNELHKIYSDLEEHLACSDKDLLCYSSHDRRAFSSLIVLLRANMNVCDTDFYQKYYQYIQIRFANPIFKDYFPND